jgi:hypothetical protein
VSRPCSGTVNISLDQIWIHQANYCASWHHCYHNSSHRDSVNRVTIIAPPLPLKLYRECVPLRIPSSAMDFDLGCKWEGEWLILLFPFRPLQAPWPAQVDKHSWHVVFILSSTYTVYDSSPPSLTVTFLFWHIIKQIPCDFHTSVLSSHIISRSYCRAMKAVKKLLL